MKKIAILTQPLGSNYGGIIQNYALQFVLKKKGYEVETIARENNKVSKFRKGLSILKNETYNRIRGFRYKIFSDKEKNYITSEMYRFIDRYINISKKIYTNEDLSKYFIDNFFDIVIVGSDQTWRPKYSPNIYNYFLDFLVNNKNIKKIAYASSFGTDNWEFTEHETSICRELVKQFDAVSVREESGVLLCKNNLEIDANCVLDPTLLLSKEDYIDLFKNSNLKQKGVFNYVLDKEPQKQNFINHIAFTLNLNTFVNQPNNSIGFGSKNNSSNIEDYKFPSLENWLKSFYDADFVVTDSFHGTVFSIIFNKPFFSIVNKERGAARFYSLLEKFGLEDRLISDYNNFDEKLLSNKIDFDKVNIILNELKIKSNQFIDNQFV